MSTYVDPHEKDGQYQGWTNYETWSVALWMMNTEAIYRHIWSHRPVTPQLAEVLIREIYPANTPDDADVNLTDWTEIAEAINED